MNKFKKLEDQLRELTAIPSPSGFEEPMIKYMYEKAKAYGIKAEVDSLGNVITSFRAPSKGPKIMIIAHMDEVGMIIRKISSNGFLRVEKIGGIPEKILLGCKVLVRAEKGNFIEGIVGSKSHHLTAVSERYKVIPIEELYIDIGCSSSQEVLSLGVNVGSSITYARDFIQNGSIVFSPAIDNRGGCLVLLCLMERLLNKEYFPEIYLVGSVQEEYNLRGVLPAARAINPDFAIAIDVAVSCDTPELDKTDVRLGGGPVINTYSFHGRGTLGGVVPNPKLLNLFEKASNKADIQVQRNVFYGGLTDASFLQLENKGIPSIEVGFPARYTHTPMESCHLRDIEQLIKLLEVFILNLPKDVDLSRI
mgnify:CR=1 FL=1